jgi:NADPH:quinone reductase
VRAVVATPDGPTWTEIREVPEPEPGPDEALIAVRAFSVNRGELTLVKMRGDGWQPGQDVAGEVVRAAADGSGPPAGALVAGLADWHGWAELAAVPAHRLAVIPEGVELAQAAALPMAGTTAANLVRRGGPLLGGRVLIPGASGGVGHLAVQLAAIGGAHVTGVARPERAEMLRTYGAHEVAGDPADASGLYDLVLESIGGATLSAALGKVAPDGTLVSFGNSSRQQTEIGFPATFLGHEEAVITSYFSARHEADAGKNLEFLLAQVAAGRLHVNVGFTGTWEQLDEALDGLAERRFTGKAVLFVA